MNIKRISAKINELSAKQGKKDDNKTSGKVIRKNATTTVKTKKKSIKSGGLVKCPGEFLLKKWCSTKRDELNENQGKKDDNDAY